MNNPNTILITGGAGFIGSHLVRRMVNRYSNTQFVNLDALTYVGDTAKLKDIAYQSNYQFVHGDINDTALVKKLFTQYDFEELIQYSSSDYYNATPAIILFIIISLTVWFMMSKNKEKTEMEV